MRQILIFIFVSILFLVSACLSNSSRAKQEVERVRKEWAPDTRTAVYDVSIVQQSNKIIVKGETSVINAKQELLKELEKVSSTVIDSLVVLPKTDIENKWALTTISVANLRDKPKHSAQLVSQIICGTPVKILKTEGSWSLIQCPDQYIAWTNNSSLQFMNDEALQLWKTSDRAIVLYNDWLVDEQGLRISDLVLGSIVNVDDIGNQRARVSLPDGRNGTISSKSISSLNTWFESVELRCDNLISTSQQFMGLPYLWGGTSSKAVDCSGFMKNIYFINGYILARDASQQKNYGLPVDLEVSKLKKGDLLFFGESNPPKVTHVAMYIGDTEFVHASGRVKINSFDSLRSNFSNYRTNSWLGAQRYVNQSSSKGFMPVKEHSWYVHLD